MNWNTFTTTCVSVALLTFPQNGIPCGPSEDPYDYFTSFFSNSAGTDSTYKPFYYTALLKFYDDWDGEAQDSISHINRKVIEEWKDYGKAKEGDVMQLVYGAKQAELLALAESIRSDKPQTVSLSKNSLAANLLKEKKSEAANYLLFAKKTESISSTSAWEDHRRDSLAINKYIAEAVDAFAKATDPFIKNKYAFQRCKLAFYNNRHNDCIRWYNESFTETNTSAVALLALSYKAGSLFRTNKLQEAAYLFSRAFAASGQNRKSNYTGFLWATDYCNPKLVSTYTALCKNNLEKANMIAMFGMYGTEYKLDILQKVYELNPLSPLLPLLATREINKLEEQYFTPLLSKEKGGKALYVNWSDNDEKLKLSGQSQALMTAQFFEKLFADKNLSNRSFYGTAAAYLHFMNKNYEGAKNILTKTKETQQDQRIKEQTQLINLLIAANEEKTVTRDREAQLLPSMKWLVQKAKTDKDYELFCRNFFSQILAQKYEQQDDAARAALAYGMADLSFIKRGQDEYYSSSAPAIEFIRDEMNTETMLKLYNTFTSPATETEKFFVQLSSIKRDDIVDVIGTSYLRDRNYAKAIEWLSKGSKPMPLIETDYDYKTDKERTINVDPFHDYLNDWQRYTKTSPTPYTKLSLAQKLLELEAKIKSSAATEDKAKLFYTYASALYNMSYYGNSWHAVAYYRSGGDWNGGDYKLPWEKEYYGVYEARAYYQKAYEVATNKEYKAACLLMIAKCAQRQIPLPSYDYKNEAASEKAQKEFDEKFRNNALFGRFKSEFGTTKFYQYAYNRCGYLRDYVKKSSGPKTGR